MTKPIWIPTVAVEPLPLIYGSPVLPDRLWAKLDLTESGCWEWTACKYFNGYGQAWGGDKLWRIHRLVYVTHIGPIPEGLDLDHYRWPDDGCVGRACALHTRPTTRRENLLRGEGFTSRNMALTHCPSGHEYAGNNLYVDPNGGRRCRECKRGCDKRWYERKRARLAA